MLPLFHTILPQGFRESPADPHGTSHNHHSLAISQMYFPCYHLAQFFGYGVDSLPSTYFGLPLGTSYKCKTVWEPVVEKFQRGLAGWKSKLLSMGGRLTSIQSALWSIPIYFMSLFTIPASISCQLEKIMRDFLSSNKEAEMGFHWVKWDDVCLPKREGGLDIKPLRDMNKALQAKWLWRFAREDNTLWKNLVKMKYDVDSLGWWSKKSPNPHGVGCWKQLLASPSFQISCAF